MNTGSYHEGAPGIRSVLFFLLLIAAALPSGAQEAISPFTGNPRYWQYRGEPVLLLGGSDEDNLFNNPVILKDNLDTLASAGGNYIRSTLSCRDEGNVWPYSEEDGVYDLDTFNPEFWDRLETSVREAERRGIIVQLEFWATFDYYRENWRANPFNPANNSTYTTENTRLMAEWDYHPARNVQPFFFSTPENNNDTLLLSYQEAFVRKALETTLPHGNVLYCLDNETRAPAAWAHYWGAFVHEEAQRYGREVHLTEMWDQWDITHEDHARTYARPGLFAYTDVSQNNWQEGQTHYDRLIWYRNNLAEQPGGIRPMNNVKVYARLSGNRPNDYDVGVERWWRNIFAGCAGTRFHRPPSGSGLDETAVHHIRMARDFTGAFDIFSSEPHPEFLDGCDDNEAYCLAVPGEFYALYFPAGGSVSLDVGEETTCSVRWFDTRGGSFLDIRDMKPSAARPSSLILTTPDTTGMWLVLVEVE